MLFSSNVHESPVPNTSLSEDSMPETDTKSGEHDGDVGICPYQLN